MTQLQAAQEVQRSLLGLNLRGTFAVALRRALACLPIKLYCRRTPKIVEKITDKLIATADVANPIETREWGTFRIVSHGIRLTG